MLSTVHPRAGGERDLVGAVTSPVTGSSPRGRGTLLRLARGATGLRFIPARAGNATPYRRRSGSASVHPRAGGERLLHGVRQTAQGGSSPRGRGTRDQERRHVPPRRFIPARAGNAIRRPTLRASASVHPRAGGERGVQDDDVLGGSGSSPRGRGTLIRRCRGGGRRRFIPARAGNASRPVPGPVPLAVHPRAGGERSTALTMRARSSGSSPRGRGTRGPLRPISTVRRFIPARAGNAPSGSRYWVSAPVHPRAGGERLLARSGEA